jgi:hypothetical protein
MSIASDVKVSLLRVSRSRSRGITEKMLRSWQGVTLLRAVLLACAISPIFSYAHASDCRPIPGAAVLWAKPSVRFVLVGEQHGTREAPEIFGDLVCIAAKSAGRPLVVAVEHLVREQAALDAFMASSGDASAVRALIAQPPWSDLAAQVQDGRYSAAYLALIERLHRLHAEGRVARVIAIDPGGASRDAVMADRISKASDGISDALTLVFAGNAHTAKQPPEPGFQRGAASYLPPSEAVALVVADRGGTAWGCRGATPQSMTCGVQQQFGTSHAPRGITLGTAWLHGYDGTLSIGTKVTASPPAVTGIK